MAKQKYMRSLKKPYTHMKRQREKKVILLKFFYWSMANVQYCVSFRCTRSDIQREMVPWPVTYVFYILVLNQLKTKEGKSPFETFVADPVLVSIFSRLKLKLNHSVENDLVVVWSPIIWKQKWKQTDQWGSISFGRKHFLQTTSNTYPPLQGKITLLRARMFFCMINGAVFLRKSMLPHPL